MCIRDSPPPETLALVRTGHQPGEGGVEIGAGGEWRRARPAAEGYGAGGTRPREGDDDGRRERTSHARMLIEAKSSSMPMLRKLALRTPG